VEPETIDEPTSPQTEEAPQPAAVPHQEEWKPPPAWDDVAKDFSKAFPELDSEVVKSRYEQARNLAIARNTEAQPEHPAAFWLKSASPITSLDTAAMNQQYKTARERYESGQADAFDIQRIARFERQQQVDSERSLAQGVGGTLASVPGAILKYGALGPAALPFMAVEGTLERATGKAVSQGGEFYSPKNLLPSAALGTANAMVLGRLGKYTQGVANPVAKWAASTAAGVGELEAVKIGAGLADKVLPTEYQTKENFGILGAVVQGKMGTALKEAVEETAMMGGFSAAHAFGAITSRYDKLRSEGVAPDSTHMKEELGKIVEQVKAKPVEPDPTLDVVKGLTGQDHTAKPVSEADFLPASEAMKTDVAKKQAVDALMKSGMSRAEATKRVEEGFANTPQVVMPTSEGVRLKTSPGLHAQDAEFEVVQPKAPGNAPEAPPGPPAVERRVEPAKLPGTAPVAYADVPEAVRSEFEKLTAERNAAFAAKTPEGDATVAALKEPISKLILENPGLRERSVMAKPRKVAEPQEGPQPPEERRAALEARIADAKSRGEPTDRLEAMLGEKPAKPSLLERLKAKGRGDVAAPEQQAQDPRKIRTFDEYNPPDEATKAGLTKDEAYIHEQLMNGRSLRDVAEDPAVKNSITTFQGVAAAQLRAAGKLGMLDAEGKPKSATTLLRERYIERARTGQADESDHEGFVEDQAHKAVAAAAAEGFALDLAAARKEVKARADTLFDHEVAYQNKWKKFFEKAARSGRKFSPEEYAEFNRQAARGELPGGKTPERKAVEPEAVRPDDTGSVQPGAAQRPPVEVEANGQGDNTSAPAGGSEAAGNKLTKDVPQATRQMAAELASSGNKWAVEQLRKELTDLYDVEVAKAIIDEAKKTPPSEEAAKAFASIKSVGLGRTAQVNAANERGAIRDQLLRHAAGEEYQSVIREAQKNPVLAQEAEGLANQAIEQGRGSGKAEGIKEVAQATGHDPAELERLLDESDRAEREAIQSEQSGPTGGSEPSDIPFRREPGRNEPITGPSDPTATPIGRSALRDFLSGESGHVDLSQVAPVVQKKTQEIHDNLAELSGRIYPRTSRLSKLAANAMARYISVKTYSHEATGYFVDKILGPKITPEQDLLYGTAFQEMRHRVAKERVRQEQYKAEAEALHERYQNGDSEKAGELTKRATALKEQANDIVSFIGQDNSPLKTEADYRAALPELSKILKRYGAQDGLVPVMEENYRSATGMEVSDPIDSLTQIPGLPMNAIAVKPGEETPTTVYIGGGRGNLKNVRQGKLGFTNKAMLASDAYDTRFSSIIENTLTKGAQAARKAEMNRALVSEGVAVWGVPGAKGDKIGREALVGHQEFSDVNPPRGSQEATNGQTSLYVKTDGERDTGVAGEYRKALDVDKKTQIPGLTPAMNFINSSALMSTVEGAYHTKNMLTNLTSAGSSPVDVIKNAVEWAKGSESFKKNLVDLAFIGAQKDFNKRAYSDWNPLKWTAAFLHSVNDVMRVTMDQAHQRLVEKGEFPDTEAHRRDWVNTKMGQYNRRAQQDMVVLARDLGFGPFATAGSQFVMGGARSIYGGPGVEATSTAAAARLRAASLGRVAVLLGGAAAINALVWGRADGDDKTPWGSIKVYDDGNGKSMYIDPLGAFSGVRRGLRMMGLTAISQGIQKGQPAASMADSAMKDAASAIIRPFTGPAWEFGHTVATGKNALDRKVAESADYGESQYWKNFKAAIWNTNPTVAQLTGKDSLGESSAAERATSILAPFAKWTHDTQPPEVANLFEALHKGLDVHREAAMAARKQGLKAKQPPDVAALSHAAILISDLQRKYNTPGLKPEVKQQIREAQKTIANAAMQKREAIKSR